MLYRRFLTGPSPTLFCPTALPPSPSCIFQIRCNITGTNTSRCPHIELFHEGTNTSIVLNQTQMLWRELLLFATCTCMGPHSSLCLMHLS